MLKKIKILLTAITLIIILGACERDLCPMMDNSTNSTQFAIESSYK